MPSSNPAHAPLWELDNVTVRGSSRPRLSTAQATIYRGTTLVLGDSGAGKSTLLNLLTGMEHPTSGRLTRCFNPVTGRLPLFWVPAGGGLWSHVTVREHLQIVSPPALLQNAETSLTCLRQIEDLLRDFDLMELSNALPGNLSQGEQSRLSVARALASEAEVLILDEPLVHTSSIRLPHYWRTIRQRCRLLQTNLVIATHDLTVPQRDSDALIILDRGRICGTVDPAWSTENWLTNDLDCTPAREILIQLRQNNDLRNKVDT